VVSLGAGSSMLSLLRASFSWADCLVFSLAFVDGSGAFSTTVAFAFAGLSRWGVAPIWRLELQAI
jgi:hypothetical protein